VTSNRHYLEDGDQLSTLAEEDARMTLRSGYVTKGDVHSLYTSKFSFVKRL